MVETPDDYKNEIEFLQGVTGKFFPVYKTEVEFDIVSVYVRVFDGEDIEDRFDSLRKELVPQNYIPFLSEESGEYIVKYKKQEEKNYRSVKTNLMMLFITIGTALIAGTYQWGIYDPVGGMFSLYNLLYGGFYFTLPLLTILGIHEMGHYFMAKFHKIKASLPFFMPAPPPLGTIGAFISIREPIPDKKSLLDVGIAGPICGFIVAVPVSIIGLYLGATGNPSPPMAEDGFRFLWSNPIIIQGLAAVLPWHITQNLHPTLFAGWVGFLVTGLNLLPASQLDGGHVVRSLLGENSKYISYLAFGFLMVVGIWKYPGWIIFGVLILFLGGVKHPPPLNDITNLDNKRKIIGVLGVVILLISFHPIPVEQQQYSYDFQMELDGVRDHNVLVNGSTSYEIDLRNTGKNIQEDDGITYNVSYSLSNKSWQSQLSYKENMGDSWRYVNITGNQTYVRLDVGENITYKLTIEEEGSTTNKTDIEFKVKSNATGRTKTMKMTTKLGFSMNTKISGKDMLIKDVFLMEREKTSYIFNLTVNNKGRLDSYRIDTVRVSNRSWNVSYTLNNKTGENLNFTVQRGSSADVKMVLYSDQPMTRSKESIKIELKIESDRTTLSREHEIVGVLP
ncbi:MAG: site-2 protease family protein [Thermoplasmatota archaeon]